MPSSSPAIERRTLVALILALGLGTATVLSPRSAMAETPGETEATDDGSDAGEPAPAPDPTGDELEPSWIDEEIIVFSDLDLARQRHKLDTELRKLGYRPGKRKEDRTVYRPEIPWKPSVVIYDEGFMMVRRSPVRFEPYIAGRSKLRYLACIPPFGLMCLRVGGQLVSARKLNHQKEDVVRELQADFHDWREVIVDQAYRYRIEEQIPDLLEASWDRGLPMAGGDTTLPSPADRRLDILDFWASRACTPEGDEVAELVSLFIDYQIDASDWPTTPEERSAANGRASCGRRLQTMAP